MEPIAVCHTTITPELFRESHAVVFDRKKQKTLLLCGIVFAAFGLAFLLVRYLLNRVIVLGGPVLVMGLFVIGWSFVLPHSEYKRKYKIMCQKNGGAPIERTVTFYETSLTVASEGEVLADIDYTEVKDWKETEHLAVLICEDRTGVLVEKAKLSGEELERIRMLIDQQD
ncbi:MAG: YcxB family protein [Oscillospiraceae bacterium]|nr:YcxB family protein [Oscillospiraceae bacterium]